MDRPVALAAAETDGETSRHVAGSSPGHLELLPDEGTDGCGGSRQRQHQKSASSRPWLSRHELPAAEGAALGHHKDRIHRFSESRVECALLQIVVQNRIMLVIPLSNVFGTTTHRVKCCPSRQGTRLLTRADEWLKHGPAIVFGPRPRQAPILPLMNGSLIPRVER